MIPLAFTIWKMHLFRERRNEVIERRGEESYENSIQIDIEQCVILIGITMFSFSWYFIVIHCYFIVIVAVLETSRSYGIKIKR